MDRPSREDMDLDLTEALRAVESGDLSRAEIVSLARPALRRALYAEHEAGRALRSLDQCRDDWQRAMEDLDEAREALQQEEETW